MNQQERNEYAKTLEVFREENTTGKRTLEVREIIDRLHRYEKTLHRLDELACNGHPKTVSEWRDGKHYVYEVEDEDLRKRSEKREESIQKKVIELVQSLGFRVEFNGDPRGGAIRVLLPSGKTNGWDGKTWGIYW